MAAVCVYMYSYRLFTNFYLSIRDHVVSRKHYAKRDNWASWGQSAIIKIPKSDIFAWMNTEQNQNGLSSLKSVGLSEMKYLIVAVDRLIINHFVLAAYRNDKWKNELNSYSTYWVYLLIVRESRPIVMLDIIWLKHSNIKKVSINI